MIVLFKIKAKYLNHMFKYAKTSLDLKGAYDKETWHKAGFGDLVLEEVTEFEKD
jgi:hypothetical protein